MMVRCVKIKVLYLKLQAISGVQQHNSPSLVKEDKLAVLLDSLGISSTMVYLETL